jgi:hypothetical protein
MWPLFRENQYRFDSSARIDESIVYFGTIRQRLGTHFCKKCSHAIPDPTEQGQPKTPALDSFELDITEFELNTRGKNSSTSAANQAKAGHAHCRTTISHIFYARARRVAWLHF